MADCRCRPPHLTNEQLIPEISSLTPLTTLIPLIAVLAISAIKDAVDDIVSYIVFVRLSYSLLLLYISFAFNRYCTGCIFHEDVMDRIKVCIN